MGHHRGAELGKEDEHEQERLRCTRGWPSWRSIGEAARCRSDGGSDVVVHLRVEVVTHGIVDRAADEVPVGLGSINGQHT